MPSNTATDRIPPSCLPLKDVDGSTVHVRIGVMREHYHDFLLEVYHEHGPQCICQIMGMEYFDLKEVKRQFRAQSDVDPDIKTYDEWNVFMGRLIDIYTGGKS